MHSKECTTSPPLRIILATLRETACFLPYDAVAPLRRSLIRIHRGLGSMRPLCYDQPETHRRLLLTR